MLMHYFAYGSNMDPRAMHEAVSDAVLVGPGRLDGYRLVFNVYSDRWDGGAANLEPDEKAHVWGVVWDVPAADIPKLDTYVGHPTFYRQDRVGVSVGDDLVQCLTYHVAHQQGYVRPTDRYVQHAHAAMRQQGLPPEALDEFDRAARPPRPSIGT